MTSPTPKKLSRRDAIKILGAAAGASVLANLPSKWSTPELTSGVLPAHAQTSGCTIGSSSMLIEFVSVTGQGIDSGPFFNPAFSTSGITDATGYAVLFPCQAVCMGFQIITQQGTTATVRITINGVVVTIWNFVGDDLHYVLLDGSTGTYSIDTLSAGKCFLD